MTGDWVKEHRALLLGIPAIVACVMLLLLGLRQTGKLEFFQLAVYDLLVSYATPASGWTAPVALVEIDEQDIQTLGQWPLSDQVLAETLESFVLAGARTIGVDIYRDLPVPPGTGTLASLLKERRNVIFVEKFALPGSVGIAPPEILHGTDQVGFSDLVVDQGGVVRRNLLFQGNEQGTGYSLGLRLALDYLAAEGIYPAPAPQDPSVMQLGQVVLPPLQADHGGYVDLDRAGYQIMLDYIGGAEPFARFSLGELIGNEAPLDQLADRIVLLGVASESVKDAFYTPHAITSAGDTGISGITVHAHAVNQLLHAALLGRKPIGSWSEGQEWLWIFGWTLLGALAGLGVGSAVKLALVSLLGLTTLAGMAVYAFTLGWWIPLVPAITGWVLASFFVSAFLTGVQRRAREMLMRLFEKQVSPEIAKTIWERREEILRDGRMQPRTMTATVLFTDLRGFTNVSESLGPQTLMDWLNTCMASLTCVIMRHGGVVDDYAGDGIKANFGIPLPSEDAAGIARDAQGAVDCALAIAQELNRLNEKLRSSDLPRVGIRIGIHTGSVTVGTLGSEDRMKFTSVGRNVNVASRLESLKGVPGEIVEENSEAGCRIFVSSSTFDHLEKEKYGARAIGKLRFKGIEEEIEVFQIITGCVQQAPTPV